MNRYLQAITGKIKSITKNLILNGSFDTGSNWNLVQCSISSGLANINTLSAYITPLTQLKTFKLNSRYRVTFTISNYVSGAIYPLVGWNNPGIVVSKNGTYSCIVKCLDATNLNVFYLRVHSAGFVGSIDNVIVSLVIN